MGLRKAIKTHFGVDAEYWNIAIVGNNFKDKVLVVDLYGYASEPLRVEGAEPMTGINMTFREEDYPGDITREQLYTLIKTTEQFAGAEDIYSQH